MFSEEDVVLKMEGICKAFGSVRALEGVDLTPHRGEVLGLSVKTGRKIYSDKDTLRNPQNG